MRVECAAREEQHENWKWFSEQPRGVELRRSIHPRRTVCREGDSWYMLLAYLSIYSALRRKVSHTGDSPCERFL